MIELAQRPYPGKKDDVKRKVVDVIVERMSFISSGRVEENSDKKEKGRKSKKDE